MGGELGGCAVGAIAGDGGGHVGDAKGAPFVLIGMGEGEGLPLIATKFELEIPPAGAEGVGVGDGEGALGAVDFDAGEVAGEAVEGHDEGGEGAGGELEGGGEVGGGFDGDLEPAFFLGGDGAGGVGGAGEAGDLGDGAEEVDQGGEVVGAHIEHRAAADLVVELGVGVPGFVAGGEHEGGEGDGAADGAGVEEVAGGLLAGAEEGVGGAADAEVFLLGEIEDLAAFGAVDAEGFFGVGVFAGVERLEGDGDVGLGDGEVEDDVDGGVGHELVDGAGGGDVVLGGLGAGAVHVEVGDGGHVEDGEVLGAVEIGVGDGAAADNADFYFGGHGGKDNRWERGGKSFSHRWGTDGHR